VFLRKLRRFIGFQLISLLAVAAQPLRFHADTSETVNVLYHAACLSGHIGCSKSIFEAFWHGEMKWQPADRTALDRFAAVFDDAVRAAAGSAPAPLMPNFLGYFPAMNARRNLLLSVIEGHPDTRLRAPLDHFRHRLHPWLQSTGNATIRRHTPAAVNVLDKHGMPDVMAHVAAFMESPIPTRDVFIHAIARPFGDPKQASATVRANHFFVEVTSADKPEDTAWKAAHELTHYLYEGAPRDKHIVLMNQFLAVDTPAAPAFYALLNDSLATAVQLLACERFGIPMDDPYNHPYFPRLARATLPLLKKALSEGHPALHTGFVADYIRAGSAALDADVDTPAFQLSAAAILPENGAEDAANALSAGIQPAFSTDRDDEWKKFENLSAVYLVTYPHVSGIPLAAVQTGGARALGWVYPRGAKARVYILAGKTPADILDAVKRFVELKSSPAEGLLFTVP
jgi:hypothetical protein